MEANLAWLENPEVFAVNRLEAHSDHHFYLNSEEYQKGEESLRYSLNGTWDFCFSSCPAERPEKFFEVDADRSAFGAIQVPGHIELQGYGNIQYINTAYPWEGHTFLRPPHVDWEHNTVGSYVKYFDLPEGFAGKRVCISFQGVESGMFLWLNGTFVGYAEDGFTPSDFDLTELVKEKDNCLCVEVYKRTSGSWIEDQDFFRFSGIFREVFLYAKPEVHVEDLWLKAGLQEDYATGTLAIQAKISGPCGKVRFCLSDSQGTEVAAGMLKKEDNAWISENLELPEIHVWYSQNPYLYTICLETENAQGIRTEFVPYRVGFRRFEMKNKIMCLNGERLVVNGVNRHEWNARSGRAITEADMRRDIEIFKKNNINAVRTCHYPDQSLWYQLCDENGILMMDETNLESHGSWQKGGSCEPSWNVPGSLPEWKACVLDRAKSMLERDKNHTAILWWSCGNESYAGENILAMSRYFHEMDPSRLVHYEGVFWNRAFDETSDVESRMYASPEAIREFLSNDPQKPFLLCEYMHDMGNSIGGMESYIRLLDEFPMYQGGFIWDYIDQALYFTNENGEEVLGYGGDFGERPTDYNFSANGIVFADRTEKPAMQDVRYWYASPEERAAQDEENGRCAFRGETELRRERERRFDAAKAPFVEVIHGDVYVGVKGENFHVIFSFQAGGPISMISSGQELLYRAPKPAFWRASTENDIGNGFPQKSAVWFAAEQFSHITAIQIEEFAANRVEVLNPMDFAGRSPAAEDILSVKLTYTFESAAVPGMKTQISYIVDGYGRVKVELQYQGQKGLPELPVFGLRFETPKPLKNIVWQGLSGETYPDRYRGGKFGIHTEQPGISNYLVPQENRNHMNTQWAEFGKARVAMDQEPFHFSAIPHTPIELESALHRHELKKSDRTVISILARMRGVGGIDSWGSDVEAPYHISGEDTINFSFWFEL